MRNIQSICTEKNRIDESFSGLNVCACARARPFANKCGGVLLGIHSMPNAQRQTKRKIVRFWNSQCVRIFPSIFQSKTESNNRRCHHHHHHQVTHSTNLQSNEEKTHTTFVLQTEVNVDYVIDERVFPSHSHSFAFPRRSICRSNLLHDLYHFGELNSSTSQTQRERKF